MTSDERLVYMANQIARNLAVRGAAAAAAELADHLVSFWEPGMRRRLLDASTTTLDPIAAAAVTLLRERGAPAAQTGATVFASGSDAG